jgi:branched-chain amino acid transport system ATP-binding protein
MASSASNAKVAHVEAARVAAPSPSCGGKDRVLAVDAIRASYGESVILESVSFDVGRGEVVCLLGANGAGKTTTMMALTGLIPVQGGNMTFLGKNLRALASHDRVAAGLALSPEARQVFPSLTVMENLLLGSYTKGARMVRRERLDLVFEVFPKLLEREAQRAGLMSGGEQQMLAIGRALMSDPKLLLLDEPSLGLSPKLVQSTFEAIDRVARTGISVLMVEQNTYAALSISQRGYVLAGGRIVAQGSAQELASSSIVQESFLGKRVSV